MISFAEKVIRVVRNIKRGDTLTYGEVAKKAGNPKAARAVGRILNTYDSKKYPGTPCHRVIGKDGSLTGFRWGIEKKRAMLKKEGVVV